MNRVVLIAAFLGAHGACEFAFAAAPSEKSAPLPPQHAAFFEQKVRPILVERCYECHSQQSKILQGGLLLDSLPGWKKGGESGEVIVPGKPEESLLIRAVRYLKDEFVHMPPKGKMSDDEVAVLVEWVKLGAPDPRTEAVVAAPKRVINIEEGKKHWAFQPLASPKPPHVKNDAWCRTPVDRFIQAKLEAAKLQANPQADRRTLVRRAYFDLIGLPPKPEEVEAFVNDPAPDAYEKLLDRLLANPHFGERWGRHWLDLARYAESHGFEQDYDRPNAYHYRDFVIRALNDDLPYDKFVKWQIAGDEYEPENPQALMATGFLAAGVHATQITANQAEKERYDELDDISRTIGTTMLGLTIGCARCHDHKYDPVTQADYFRIVSTFTKTVRSDYDLNVDPQGYAKAVAAFEREQYPLVGAYQRRTLVLREKFETWLAAPKPSVAKPVWQAVTPQKVTAPDAVKFTIAPRGDVTAVGTQFFALNYTIAAETDLQDIRALRLTAAAVPSLPAGGPGTTPDGGFHISKVKVQAAPQGKPAGDAKPVEAKIVSRTTAAPKDGKLQIESGKESPASWIVESGDGIDRGALFEFEKPLGFDGGTKLTITLEFSGNYQGLGRFQAALATGAGPHAIDGATLNERVYATLERLTKDPKLAVSPAENDALFDWYCSQDAEVQKAEKALAAIEVKRPKPQVVKALISGEGLPAVRLHTQGPDFYEKTFVVRRGDPNQKVEEAKPGFVQVLLRTADDSRWRKAPPAGAKSSFDRRNLAEWLCDVDAGAGHLLARVIVNRLWYYHTGRGLVATPSDFGLQGERPTHPELLDYLAGELVRGGWRLKPIHKLIMTSAVYMQTSATDAVRTKADPDNRLCWHKPLRRLEAEIVRDAIMATAGVLDEKMFGPGSMDQAQPRRSIYFFVKRSKLTPMMTLFDGPDTLQDLAVRPETTVAPQALMLLNNEVLRSYAEAFAKKIRPQSPGDVEQGIEQGYLRAIGRAPTADELRDTAGFVRAQAAVYRTEGKGDSAEALAWADFCQVLFSLNEFIFVD